MTTRCLELQQPDPAGSVDLHGPFSDLWFHVMTLRELMLVSNSLCDLDRDVCSACSHIHSRA